jgi:uncharacterized protein YhaN
MKLAGLDIERYGRWERFSQSFHPSGVTVVYGPNEAGKTTLLRFIRGVLYGFPPEEKADSWRRSKRLPQGGSLTVEHQGQTYQIHRHGHPNEPGLLSIQGVDAGTRTARLLEEMVASTDGKLFESVFAVGLSELQQFATLNDDEVARHLYGMTLGPQGALLMELPGRVDRELEGLWDGQRDSGLIRQLLRRREELTRQAAQHRARRNRYRELLRRERELEEKLAGHRRRQTELQQSLRGLSFTERVWSPWQRLRELRRELAALPDFAGFPADGVRQMARLDQEIQTTTAAVEQRAAALRDLQLRIAQQGAGPEIRRFGRSIRRLMDERSEIRGVEQRLEELTDAGRTLHHDLQKRLSQLGPKWTLARIDQMALGAEGTARLTAAARDFQAVEWRTRRNQRWYRRLSLACRDRELALKTELMQLGATDEPFDHFIALAQERLAQVTELARLHNEAAALHEHSKALDRQLELLHERLGLPDWAYALLAFFAVGGVGLFAAGLSQGVTTGWLVGLIYIVLSATVAGTAWALKHHSDRDVQEQVHRMRERRRDLQSELVTVERKTRELLSAMGLSRPRPHLRIDQRRADADLVAEAARRLAQLEAAQREWQRLKRFRNRLSVMRGNLQTRQRELSLARADWCRAVTALGLDETVDVEGAFRQYQTAWELVDGRRRWKLFDTEAAACRTRIELFAREIEELGRRMRREEVPRGAAISTLEQWERELEAAIAARREVRLLKQQLREQKRELVQIRRHVQALEHERAALLKGIGATHRSQFEDRLALRDRRKQVEQLLHETQRELDLLARTEPDLALVEDDLIQYQPARHKERMQAAQRELQQTEQLLLQTSEQLGTVRRELQDLEADRGDRTARAALARTQAELDEAVERWFAAALGAEAVEAVCLQFEQTHQPETLAAAIPYLQRLTCGKYRRLWTALGRRHLFVDDELGRPWSAEQLSGGTREQLFLAIRLAMVRSLSRHGVELPMVLDDVTVNFDNERSAAAVETLIDFAGEGQQVVVLTSHRHFAQMFQSRGIEPIWLPPSAGVDLEERRAG